jgi:hypothetical protein
MAASIRVDISGPLFDGTAQRAADEWVHDTQSRLAEQGAAIVRDKAMRFNKSRRGGTGGAARSVSFRADGASFLFEGKSDKGTVWWPWLEGTSRRNLDTSFKGYHAFRLAKNIIAKKWRKVAQDELDKKLAAMGGEP